MGCVRREWYQNARCQSVMGRRGRIGESLDAQQLCACVEVLCGSIGFTMCELGMLLAGRAHVWLGQSLQRPGRMHVRLRCACPCRARVASQSWGSRESTVGTIERGCGKMRARAGHGVSARCASLPHGGGTWDSDIPKTRGARRRCGGAAVATAKRT